MDIKERFALKGKTTMRIGGVARYYAELTRREDIEKAVNFSREKGVPLLPLGSGSNTIFDDGEIAAFVVQVKHATVMVEGNTVTVGAGMNLPMLINNLAIQGLDLSPLTGIPGTVGGAIFGNAGQGPTGVWIDSFVESVTVFAGGEWRTLSKVGCEFAYRESGFKSGKWKVESGKLVSPIIWETVLTVPSGEPTAVALNIQTLLKKRIETQPHMKTAGSCFKAVGEVPAWKLIDAAGLRGYRAGGIEISPKHANFLTNTGEATFADAVSVVETVKEKVPVGLEVEMRFMQSDGTLKYEGNEEPLPPMDRG